MWIIDFPPDMSEKEASLYEAPFERIKKLVKPLRDKSKRPTYRNRWWVHAEPVAALRKKLTPLKRFVATPVLTKYRLFVWLTNPTLPDHQVVAFARDDDYFYGVLHSRIHEEWALALGTRLEDRPRYTPTTCFETFPLPWPPGQEPQNDSKVQAIATAAAQLDKLRTAWLSPQSGLVEAERKLRTLTNLYNLRPTWLMNAHTDLNDAVFAAYGWPSDLSRDETLARLLALNLERAAAGSTAREPLTP
jgi:hypothetical protein